VQHHHFNNNISSVQPSAHNDLQEVFSGKFFFFIFDFYSDDLKHFFGLFFVSFHDGSGHLDNGVHNEVTESSLHGFSTGGDFLSFPFLVFGIKVVVSPKSLHHLGLVGLEFGGIDLGESSKSEGVLIFSRSESNITFLG